ncbi:hypothetical protein A2U01_0088379, partial [Trifolium medium]|nr:hypothetical protein [Trifolium medium]
MHSDKLDLREAFSAVNLATLARFHENHNTKRHVAANRENELRPQAPQSSQGSSLGHDGHKNPPL